MAILKLLFSAQGRISRLTFWLYFLGYLVSSFLAFFMDILFSTYNEDSGLGFFSSFLLPLALFFPSLFIAIKRSHDLNCSGWHLLWGVVPIANLLLIIELAFMSGTKGDNKYGASPKTKLYSFGETKCPYCSEPIKKEAIVCKNCGKDLFILPQRKKDESSNEVFEPFVQQISVTNLDKPAIDYLNQGIALSENFEFDNAILEFKKAIKLSTPEENVYQIAQNELMKMGFSESDISKVSEIDFQIPPESKKDNLNDTVFERFIQQISAINLDRPAIDYLNQGAAFSENFEFDNAILEFIKVIKLAAPDEHVYHVAKNELSKMGFSESDISKVS